ncbi:MAG TPA: hypothetical protein VLF66_19680 [Thermoanaerobaculia bacterium]|nr:hypothetical protein [Thermoanaerobaculia bacterium]
MPYDVFLYNVPKVTEDGEKVIPVPPCKTERFDDLDAAKKLAADSKDEFDRAVVMSVTDEKQQMVERYMDGAYEKREEAVPA